MEARRSPPVTSNRFHSLPEWAWYGIGGFSAGILLAVFTVGLPLFRGNANLPTPTIQALNTSTPTLIVPTSTSEAAQATQVEIQAIIETGCQYISNTTLDPQSTIDLLTAHLAEITEHTDLARAYECLGTAEAMLNQFQMAAYYYDQLYLLEPKAEYLLMAATCYEYGGDLKKALEKYLLVVETDDPAADEYREMAQQRAFALQEILQNKRPTTSPPPTLKP